jgi:hypothetical protein
MALNIASYNNQYSTTPLVNAYAWITTLLLDFEFGTGALKVGINVDADSANAGKPPIERLGVSLGQTLAPGVTFPTFAQLMGDPAFAAAFAVIRKALFDALLTDPRLAGSTEV